MVFCLPFISTGSLTCVMAYEGLNLLIRNIRFEIIGGDQRPCRYPQRVPFSVYASLVNWLSWSNLCNASLYREGGCSLKCL